MAAASNGAAESSVQVAGPQQKSLEDAARAIDNTPLFMKQLPAAGEMDEYLATQMDALQSLLYEGDAEGRWKSFETLSRLCLKKVDLMTVCENRTGAELQGARQ